VLKAEFLHWIHERDNVRKKKESGLPKPWSDDPVFQTTYFCNVRREDDRVTRWLRSNWLVDDRNYEFAMVLARLINKPSTLSMIGYPYDKDIGGLAQTLWLVGRANSLCIEERMPFWGNAYVVTTHGQPISKLQYLLGLLEAAHKVLPLVGVPPTCEDYHNAFKRLEGFADFMAAQIVADLKNTVFHPLANAEDWYTFCAPGPGSKRGMEWYFGKKVPFQQGIVQIREECYKEFPYNICNQDLQNCLCEFDKYMRVKTGSGRSKRKYSGQ
jgi:hypothetical protein